MPDVIIRTTWPQYRIVSTGLAYSYHVGEACQEFICGLNSCLNLSLKCDDYTLSFCTSSLLAARFVFVGT